MLVGNEEMIYMQTTMSPLDKIIL